MRAEDMSGQNFVGVQHMSDTSNPIAKVREFYGRAAKAPPAEQYSSEFHVSSVFMAERMHIIYGFLNDLAPEGGRVLDVGCGPGPYARDYVAKGYNYFGMDICPETIAQARTLNTANELTHKAQFCVGNVENIGFDSNFFDIAVVVYVFEYLNSDEKALHELYRILKPGGILIVGLNNRYSYNRLVRLATVRPLKGVLSRVFPFRHGCQAFRYRSHHPPQFTCLLRSSGFAFLGGRYCNFSIIPFNLRMPKAYFALQKRLTHLLIRSRWDFPFSTYIGVFQAQHR